MTTAPAAAAQVSGLVEHFGTTTTIRTLMGYLQPTAGTVRMLATRSWTGR